MWEFIGRLKTAELQLGDFLIPWAMMIFVLGFLAAWGVVAVMERKGWTRHVWHLPLFFMALAVFFGSLFGLALAP
ncbi:MAG TPA: DUF1656 domain-containing protein [Chthoniobacterales bacterium]